MKKLFTKIFDKQEETEVATPTQPRGFIDFETGKRVDVDLNTMEEIAV